MHAHTQLGPDQCETRASAPGAASERHVRKLGRTELRWDGERLAGAICMETSHNGSSLEWKFNPSVVLHASWVRIITASTARDQVAPWKAPASHMEKKPLGCLGSELTNLRWPLL